MNEPRPLLALYKLLWEQIKDEKKLKSSGSFTRKMASLEVISIDEEGELDDHINDNIGQFERLDNFIQRMIKERENDK